jgi:hypothetical protein
LTPTALLKAEILETHIFVLSLSGINTIVSRKGATSGAGIVDHYGTPEVTQVFFCFIFGFMSGNLLFSM